MLEGEVVGELGVEWGRQEDTGGGIFFSHGFNPRVTGSPEGCELRLRPGASSQAPSGGQDGFCGGAGGMGGRAQGHG